MKILVTGGSGFIGSNIVKQLIADGHEVAITGNITEAAIPKGVAKVLQFTFNGIDWDYLRNYYFAKGLDACFHQAANNDTQDPDRREVLNANYYAACSLFENLHTSCGCDKFIYASSTAVYGNSPSPYVEGVTELKPLTSYGLSKELFDDFAMDYAQDKRMSIIGLRYCNVYGPGEQHKGHRASMIYQMMKKIMKGDAPTLFEFGEQKRDWIYVKDVVKANMLALNHEGSGIFNCGTGIATSFNDLVRIIGESFGMCQGDCLQPQYIPNPIKDTYQDLTQCDITKIKETLGFSPDFSIEQGIADYVDWLEKI